MARSRTSSVRSTPPSPEATTPSSSASWWAVTQPTAARSSIIEEGTPGSAADAHGRSRSNRSAVRPGVHNRQRSHALGRHPSPLSLGSAARRRARRDGRLASLWLREIPDLVGVANDGRPPQGGDSLSACEGNYERYGGGVEVGGGGWREWCSRRRDRAHLDRTALAADRLARGESRHRSGLHPRNRITDARRNQTGCGDKP